MRPGICLSATPADVDQAPNLGKNRNAPQKHVLRAQIMLVTAERNGTNEIMHETGKSKTCLWRWQERFAAEGADGLMNDKTRPSRSPKLMAARLRMSGVRRLRPFDFSGRRLPPGRADRFQASVRNGRSCAGLPYRLWRLRHGLRAFPGGPVDPASPNCALHGRE
jgi:Winged helix-turn helix